MNDGQLLRYSRHILLDEIGVEGQQRLLDAKALIIGAGGLGSPAALYLASAGVGRITLADGDTVDLTNLQRQILHTTGRIGQPKACSGKIALRGINPESTGRSDQPGWPAKRWRRWSPMPTWCSIAATTSPPATPSIGPASAAPARWFPERRSALPDSLRYSTAGAITRPVTTACFPKGRMSRRCAAR
jgi:hypothetical protein